MSNVLGSANAPKGLDKSFEKIESLIDKIRSKASQPIDSKGGFTSISREVETVQSALNGLTRMIEQLNSLPEADRLSFLPPDAQKEIQQIIGSLATYADAIQAATTESKELTTAREELAKAEEKVAAAQKKVEQKSGGLEAAKIEKQAAEEAIASIEERKQKLIDLRKEQEKIEKFYSSPDEKGQKRNRSKKYDGISARPQDIKKQITDLEKASAGDKSALETWREQLKASKNDIESYIKQVGSANRILHESQAEYEALSNKVQTLNDEFQTAKPADQQAAFDALRKEALSLGASLDGISENFSEGDANELIARLISLKTKGFEQLNFVIGQAEKEIQDFGKGCKNIKDDLADGEEALQSMTEAAADQKAFEDKIKSFLGLSGAVQLMRMAFRDAIATVKELDATMTEMAVVTDLSVGDYWEQLPEYSQRASELGVSINSAYKAATLYYQQGLKSNEVTAISTETLKMAKIAGMDAAEATDKMTAALRGFNMELNEASARRVADVYSELAAVTAASTQEIANAMTKTASIAHSAGMEFETTAAFLSQIVETTRESAETAGTAMKTIIARFQELKKSPDEIDDIDGEVVDANAIETALRSVGVSLRDASGQFRELDDVFMELSSKWDTLDKNTQRYIATIAAGSRQQSRFIAMMSDYKRTQELVAKANTSAGASQRQFEKTTESLEYKLEQLKNAWHEFSMGIANSSLIKTGVDILTKFLEVINNITAGLGKNGMLGGLTKVMSVVTMFKIGQSVFNKIKPHLQKFFAEIVQMAGKAGEESGKVYATGVQRGGQSQAAKPAQAVKQAGTKYERMANLGLQVSGLGQFKQALDQRATAKFYRGYIGEANAPKRAEYVAQKQAEIKKEERARAEAEQKVRTGQDSGGKYAKQIAKADKNIEKLNADIENMNNAEQNYLENREASMKSLNQSFQTASAGLMALGAGFGMIGSAFEEAGLEEAAEVFNTMSTYATTAGAVLGIIPPILSLIQSLFPGVGAASAEAGAVSGTAGTIASTAWGTVGAIIMIVIAGIVVAMVAILVIMKLIKNASPEKKLEDASKAADEAAEAADRAAESYQNLAGALEDLGGKYDALEELTKGTKEWNKAIQDINNSVIDLIKQYPELAAFVERKDGTLHIDVESDEVQDVLNQYKASSIYAANAATSAKIRVLEAQADVAYSGVGRKGKIGSADIKGYEGDFEGKKKEQKKQRTTAVARALADGIIQEMDGTFELVNGATEKELKELGLTTDMLKNFDNEVYNSADALTAYGRTLQDIDEQTAAFYDALAITAQSLIDMSNWAQGQINQANNLVTGEDYERYRKEYEKMYEDDDAQSTEKALKAFMESQEGVEKVKRIKNNKIKYVDSDGKVQKVDKDVWMQKMIDYKATEKTKMATQNVGNVSKVVANAIKFDFPEVKIDETSISKALEDSSGKYLTAADLKQLDKVDDATLKAIYNSSETLRTYFDSGSDWANYWNTTKNNGKDIMKRVEDIEKDINAQSKKEVKITQSFMYAEQAEAFANNMKSVFENSGADGAEAVMNNFNTALKDKTEEEKSQILNVINAYDWTNIEDLNALQLQLWQTYEVGEQESTALIESIKKQNHAITSMAGTIDEFGAYYQSQKKLESVTSRITELQYAYNKALEEGSVTISTLLDEMATEYKNAYKQAKTSYDAAVNDLITVYSDGVDKNKYGGFDLTELITIKVDDYGRYQIDDSHLAGQANLANNEAVQDYIERLEKQLEKMNQAREDQKEAESGLDELSTAAKEAYVELSRTVADSLISEREKEIEELQNINDSINNANEQITNKIQEQINDVRTARQNEETEKSLEDMYNRQALLEATGSSGSTEALALQEEIKAAEQAYQDSLVDQALQNLQDANAEAAEQRERQIAIQEASLESYENSEQFQKDINDRIEKLLKGEDPASQALVGSIVKDQTLGMTDAERNVFVTSLQAMMQQALKANGSDFSLGEIADLFGIGQDSTSKIQSSMDQKALDVLRSSYAEKGFTTNNMDKSQLERVERYYGSAANPAANLAKVQEAFDNNELKAADWKYKTEQDYYAAMSENIAKGKTVDTYDQYLAKLYHEKVGQYKNLNPEQAFGGIGFAVTTKGLRAANGTAGWQVDEDFRVLINDTKYPVDMGSAADDTTAKKLEHIKNQTTTGDAAPGERMVLLGDKLYIRKNQSSWFQVVQRNNNSGYSDLKKKAKKILAASASDYHYTKYGAFKTGGLVDYTGPAWLDGTPSKPEYVLNTKQTERFFTLIDVLEGYDASNMHNEAKGDNYFNIDINVEKIEDDYDVQKMADKIRRMIYEDASYRNVNVISHLR